MPLTIAFTFPWRRYHATPWGANPNDQQVELPPSPWRILRALYAVWKQRAPRLDDGTELSEETVHRLLSRLAGQPPRYAIPPYRLAHTRHYYPDTQHRQGATSTDAALDNFAQLDGDATVYATWNLDLPGEEEKALERLLASLPYLGRADSICDARLERVAPAPAPEKHHPVTPLQFADDLGPGQEVVQLLAPTAPLDMNALLMRPVDVRRRQLFPPSSQLLDYAIPSEAAQRKPRRRAAPPADDPTTVLLSVTGTPQPRMPSTVAVTDALRMVCLKLLGTGHPTSPLVGKQADGTRRQDNHQHAHYLALPAEDGTIAHLAIWAPSGLGRPELNALSELHTRTVGAPAFVTSAPRDLNVRVLATGNAELLPDEFTQPSRYWTSCTPFIPPRHHRKNQPWPAYLRDVVHRELTARGLPSKFHVHMPGLPTGYPHYRRSRLPSHRANRSSTGQAESRHPLAITIEFDEPIPGPLSLGTLSHFGLGLFRNDTNGRGT
ncbi:type I-U CRISPR-associated protein Csb2 [Streptomyces sp. NPDC059080]|uniref:type I-G CRISPR-associated protein Csb2 n=1 Tax=Streptomyces sp. NPDC059080 TaxID=3346718 RepID=UPI0036A31CD7